MQITSAALRGDYQGRMHVRGVEMSGCILFDVQQPDGTWFRYQAFPRDIGKVP